MFECQPYARGALDITCYFSMLNNKSYKAQVLS